MGADSYVSILEGTSATAAYAEAVSLAAHDNGHGGYTGTIAESSGHEVYPDRHVGHGKWEAEHIAQGLIDNGVVRKWEHVLMVPIIEPKTTRAIKVTLNVAGLGWTERRIAVERAVRGKMRGDETIVSLTTTDGPIATKVVAKTTEGKSVRRYAVKEGTRTLATFPTQAQARAWAVDGLNSSEARVLRTQTLSVVGETVRENGEPLVTVSREITKYPVTIVATVGPRAGAKKPAAWATAGVYSC